MAISSIGGNGNSSVEPTRKNIPDKQPDHSSEDRITLNQTHNAPLQLIHEEPKGDKNAGLAV